MVSREKLLDRIVSLRGEPIEEYQSDAAAWGNYTEIVDENKICQNPLVTVRVVTYNQEEYIGSCLDSIICQVCDFEFEVVILEDCSTDSTFEICKDYQKRYPDKIRILHNNVNLYLKGISGRRSLSLSRGKLMALCEGDDYWCNDRKLQLQVEEFRRNKDTVICYTDAYVKLPGRSELVGPELQAVGYFEIADKLSVSDNVCERFARSTGAWFKTATVMYTKEFIEWYDANGIGKLRLSEGIQSVRTVAASHGRVACVNAACAVYRAGVGVGTRAPAAGIRVLIDGFYSRVYTAWDYMTKSEQKMLLLLTICQLLISKYNGPGYDRRVFSFVFANLMDLPLHRTLIRGMFYFVWRAFHIPHEWLPRRFRRG